MSDRHTAPISLSQPFFCLFPRVQVVRLNTWKRQKNGGLSRYTATLCAAQIYIVGRCWQHGTSKLQNFKIRNLRSFEISRFLLLMFKCYGLLKFSNARFILVENDNK